MEVLVVTGGIGSGKSQVCNILQEEYGIGIYKADDRVKALYYESPSLLENIENALGASFRDEDGLFAPSRLARRIFSDKAQLETVEELVFPALIEDFNTWAAGHDNETFVVFESATILEKEQFKGFGDKVILVDAPLQTRLERACARDGVSRETVLSRMDNQPMMNMISSGEIIPDVDAVIDNSEGIDKLKELTLRTISTFYGNKFNDK